MKQISIDIRQNLLGASLGGSPRHATGRKSFSRLMMALATVLVGFITLPAMAQVPEPLPVTNRWELDFKPGPLRLASVQVDGEPKLFLYLTYEVRNFDSTELRFVPSFTLVSDQGQAVPSGQDVPAEVTREIMDKLRDPLLMDQISMIGPVKRGEEHTRRGLAIWPITDADPTELSIFAAGFSGESETLELTDPRTGETQSLVFRKTRHLRYQVPGQLRADQYGDRPIPELDARWIMR